MKALVTEKTWFLAIAVFLSSLATAALMAQPQAIHAENRNSKAETRNADSRFAEQKATDGIIRFWQWRVSRDPDDYFNYDKLGVAYIRKARETGDITYYGLAEKALRKSLDLESTHREAVSATTHLASVYFAEHRFGDALACAQRALGFGTGDLSQYAIIGDTLVEMGEYDKASEDYSKLQDPNGAPYVSKGLTYLKESRLASLEFLQGNPEESIRHMRSALETATEAQMPGEAIAWTQFMLGEEFFQIGNLTNAEKYYRQAVAAYPGYHRALAGLGKVRSAQNRYQDAVEFYQKAIAVIPMPMYVAALGDVYAKMGRTSEAKKQYDLVEYIGALSAINKTVYNRELALFYADHDMKPKESLELAQKELEVRRDIYTWDSLAWALYKNGKFQEATDAMAKALRLGTKDAMLFFHAGMIYDRVGNAERSKEYLQRALTTNPHFHVFYVDIAKNTVREFGERKAVSRRQ